jgi:alkanesulfonate monooxygenase SsuD/methylene tetrahydromethanopterin reductase-like flavin-dependent oxidoreductase (luciferase family)
VTAAPALPAVSLGLRGDTDHAVIREIAPQLEAAGFHGLWLNDNHRGESLDGLAVAAAVTTRLQLGTGVIALDGLAADGILAKLGDLPVDRLVLGVGSGGTSGALARVEGAVAALRAGTSAPVVVGALGPRMRRLAAEQADGVLLNWLTPTTAASATADLRRDAGDRTVRSILYARTIASPMDAAALDAECARYSAIPTYAANFDRLGIEAIDTTIRTTADLAAFLPAVDEIVLRAITTNGSVAELERLVKAYAPGIA